MESFRDPVKVYSMLRVAAGRKLTQRDYAILNNSPEKRQLVYHGPHGRVTIIPTLLGLDATFEPIS